MSAEYLERDGRPNIAYKRLPGAGQGASLPTVLFCGGFRSDMEGTKALCLEEFCRDRGQGFVRFDYSGHGASEGAFEDGTIGSWLDDTLVVLERLTQGSVLIIGSSMGGWIALQAALTLPDRVKGMIGIAAAPDFTREIYQDELDDAQRALLKTQGYIDVPSAYSDEPYRITKALIEDGESHCLLDKELALDIPVKLLQGMQDSDVPWQKAYRTKNALVDEDRAEVILIESGDHRLSRPEDLALLTGQVDAVSKAICACT
ncbi:MAG: alpha/beta hydrolase [Rhodospirillales bacterium]|nr:alpha/beta hydrolase [Rhodospirillales bacterium]MCB9997071.1 alpha/beta hydrolase [Rhodospirillales bacterium]